MACVYTRINETFKYFFNDYHAQIFADPVFVRKIVFSLEYQRYEFSLFYIS